MVEAEELIGLVSIGDLVKFRMDKIEAEAAAMLSYIQSVTAAARRGRNRPSTSSTIGRAKANSSPA